MNYHVSVVTPPAALPVTLAEAKAHLRVLHTTEDTLIDRLIKAAVAHVESKCGAALITRTLRVLRDTFPANGGAMVLPVAPVTTVSEITYVDTAGAAQTLAGSAYVLAGGTVRSEVSPVAETWPATQRGRRQIAVTFTAGYGAASTDMPEDMRAALLLLIEHYYHHRSAVIEGTMSPTPLGVEALLGPYMTTGWI